MITNETSHTAVADALGSYLGNSRLSLGQLATKLGVSKGHLSEIKNGKKEPALNLGLRILKLCGYEADERRKWAHYYNQRISEEYLEVHEVMEGKEHVTNLNEKVSCMLSRDLDLMNAYLDIVNSEIQQRSRVYLREEYGRSIFKRLDVLVEEEVLTKNEVAYFSGLCSPIMTKNSSYEIMRRVMDDQQDKFNNDELQGKFQFDINDLSNEGYLKLAELFEKTMKEANEIVGENQQNKDNGGKRFVFQAMLGKLMWVLVLFGLSFSFSPDNAAYAHVNPKEILDFDQERGEKYFEFDAQYLDMTEDEIREIEGEDGDDDKADREEKKERITEREAVERAFEDARNTGGLGGGSSSKEAKKMLEARRELEYIRRHGGLIHRSDYAKLSWDHIRVHDGLHVDWPSMWIEGENLPVKDLCIDEKHVRSVGTVKVCAEKKVLKRFDCTLLEGSGKHDCKEVALDAEIKGYEKLETECLRYENRVLKTTIEKVKEMCITYGCTEKRKYRYKKETGYTVKVFFKHIKEEDRSEDAALLTRRF